MNDFEFPVMGISSNTIVSFRGAEELTQGSWKALDDGYYQELLLINVRGETAHVSSVLPKGKKGIWARVFGGRVEFELKLKRGENLNLDTTKSKILEIIAIDRDFWESGGSFEELVTEINTSKDWKSLIELFY